MIHPFDRPVAVHLVTAGLLSTDGEHPVQWDYLKTHWQTEHPRIDECRSWELQRSIVHWNVDCDFFYFFLFFIFLFFFNKNPFLASRLLKLQFHKTIIFVCILLVIDCWIRYLSIDSLCACLSVSLCVSECLWDWVRVSVPPSHSLSLTHWLTHSHHSIRWMYLPTQSYCT